MGFVPKCEYNKRQIWFNVRILMSVPERVSYSHQVLKLMKTNLLIHKARGLRVDRMAF